MKNDIENTDRRLALAFTIGFHTLVFLFLFFVIFKTPIPPYPEFGGGSGLEVNFGNSDQGFGDNISEEFLPVETKEISSSNDDNYIVQDNDETSTFEAPKSNVKPKNNTVIQINDPVINKNALYSKNHNANQGIAGGYGNQGKPNGDPNSKNYSGTGGNGNGDGTGTGPGTGPGSGPGTSYDLKGRKVAGALPKPKYDSDEEGKVVVSITVDQNGKVTKAVPGAKGTTTEDKTLWKQSEQAAYKAKFDSKSDAAIEQKGTITYIFLKLN